MTPVRHRSPLLAFTFVASLVCLLVVVASWSRGPRDAAPKPERWFRAGAAPIVLDAPPSAR